MSFSDVNLVDALFGTDLHKLRRSFEGEDAKGVPCGTFIWILATTVPDLKTVISTFRERHESEYGKRKRAIAERAASLEEFSPRHNRFESASSSIKFVAPSASPAVPGAIEKRKVVNIASLIASSSSRSASTKNEQQPNQLFCPPLPYIITDPQELVCTEKEREQGRRLRASLESLFIAMDVDGDGRVTWDELYSYTVSTTMHRLTVKPADVVRLYGVAKQVSRQDNIVCVRNFDELNAVAISSRHEGIELLDSASLKVVARSSRLAQFDREAVIKSSSLASFEHMNQDETEGSLDAVVGGGGVPSAASSATVTSFGGVNGGSGGGGGGGSGSSGSSSHHSMTASPTITKMCYVSSCGVVIAAADNLRLYCYSVLNGGEAATIVRGKKIPSTQYRLAPICSESVSHRITQLKIAASAPQLAFASSSAGGLSCYEVFDAHRPRLRYQFPLHNPGTIVSDFCFMSPTEHKVISTAFDRTVRVTDLHLLGEGHPESFWVVGEPEHACTHLAYSEAHELIVTASVDYQVRAWTCHSTRRPATLLFDSSNPHQAAIVGMFHIHNTPQLVSCDEGGLVKVWDLRNFRCAQSLVVGANQTEVVDEAEVHATGGVSRTSMAEMLGEQQLRSNVALNDICYVQGKESFCCVGPSKVSLHKYDAGANPNAATESFVVGVQFLADQNSVVMATPQELVTWDLASGSISATVSDPTWSSDDFSCLATDHSDRRVIAGTRSGKIFMWSAIGFNRIQSQNIQPHHAQSRSQQQQQQQQQPHHHHHSVGVTGVGFCSAQNTVVSIGTDGFVQFQRLEANVTTLTANRHLLGSGLPLCALSVSDACATIACGDDCGNVYVCDALAASGQPQLFRTTLNAAVSATTFCGSFPAVVVATADGWFHLFSCRPAPDGLLLAKWNMKNEPAAETSPSASSASPTFVSRSVRQALVAASGFDEFLERNKSILNSENDRKHATCLCFDPVSHRLFAGTNSGEVYVWSMCNIIAHYRPSLVTTSFVSLGEFLNYKWAPSSLSSCATTRKRNKKRRRDQESPVSVPELPIPEFLVRTEIHYNESNHTRDDEDSEGNSESTIWTKATRKKQNLVSVDAGAVLSIDCATLSDRTTVIVTAGESDRRCCISKAVMRPSSAMALEECGDLSYGRPSSESEATYVGGEKVCDYVWDENVSCVKLHELAQETIAPRKTCSHLPIFQNGDEENDTDDDDEISAEYYYDDDDDNDEDDDEDGERGGLLADLIVRTGKYYDRSTSKGREARKKQTASTLNASPTATSTAAEGQTLSSYRIMHPDPVHSLSEEEAASKRRLEGETRLARALRRANQKKPASNDELPTASTALLLSHASPAVSLPRPPKFQSRVGVSSAPGSARRHRTSAFFSLSSSQAAPTISDQSRRRSPGSAESSRKNKNNNYNSNNEDNDVNKKEHECGKEEGKVEEQQQYNEQDGDDDDDEVRLRQQAATTMTEQQLHDQKLNYQHRLREMSRHTKLSDKQILVMNQRGVAALEQQARELREREDELEKQQMERNLREAEVASITATVASTRDLTREDKDLAPSLPSDLSLPSLLVAAAHEARRLACAERLPPLFLGVQKETFAKAATHASARSSHAGVNSLEGIVSGDAIMCGIEHRPRTGSRTRPHSSTARGQSNNNNNNNNNNNGNSYFSTTLLATKGGTKFACDQTVEPDATAHPRFAGLCLGSNVARPPTANSVGSSAISRPGSSSRCGSKPRRCVSPPQTAGVASIGRHGAASTTTLRGASSATLRRSLTLSEQRERKIDEYEKQLHSCLKWSGGRANGLPMNRDELRKEAMLKYNLEGGM